MPIRILIAEDEENIRNLVKLHLSKEGYEVIEASNGREALLKFKDNNIDLLILDIMMPEMDGYRVLEEVRASSQIPVIFLTAQGEERNKVLGLGLGADDYVVKPFSVVELISRVQAQLRRYLRYSSRVSARIIYNGDLTLDLDSYSIKKGDTVLDLNPKELKLLMLFMENLGKVFTKKQLYEEVWGDMYFGDDNTIMVHISHIRDKIEDNPKKPKYLRTIRGIGYRMVKSNG
ncbi:response regulator transcription factor [Anaeromicrobium sediminis]|uniref:response regulator transcription factor n=1 Tax=Anaeromicrobium sediminis TaxID=1478221 RepID=UPI0026D26141|nr:response regulator transcription factor [Anaeromicrobium sediminis]